MNEFEGVQENNDFDFYIQNVKDGLISWDFFMKVMKRITSNDFSKSKQLNIVLLEELKNTLLTKKDNSSKDLSEKFLETNNNTIESQDVNSNVAVLCENHGILGTSCEKCDEEPTPFFSRDIERNQNRQSRWKSGLECDDENTKNDTKADSKEDPKKVIAKDVTDTVKGFNEKNQNEFIIQNDIKEEIFVHESAIIKNFLKKSVISGGDGESVAFEVVIGENGKEASNVSGPEGGIPHVKVGPVEGSPYAPEGKTKKKSKKLIPIHCGHCGKTFDTIYKLKKHHEDSKICKKDYVQCDVCEKRFEKLSNLEDHRKSKKKCKKVNIKCDLCEKPFKRLLKLLQHKCNKKSKTHVKKCGKPKKKKKKTERWAS